MNATHKTEADMTRLFYEGLVRKRLKLTDKDLVKITNIRDVDGYMRVDCEIVESFRDWVVTASFEI